MLGLYTAKVFALRYFGLLILTGRFVDTLKTAETEIKAVNADCSTRLLTLDLGSIYTVRVAVEEVNECQIFKSFNVLINIAGIMPYSRR